MGRGTGDAAVRPMRDKAWQMRQRRCQTVLPTLLPNVSAESHRRTALPNAQESGACGLPCLPASIHTMRFLQFFAESVFIMATSLLALLDDITTILDDVAVMSKMAVKKTSGVLGDDLALNAQQVTGVKSNRELPVVWSVFKGSLINKLILVPLALLISAFVPKLITPLLMAGGLFLCYEGVEKVLHKLLHGKQAEHAPSKQPAGAQPVLSAAATHEIN